MGLQLVGTFPASAVNIGLAGVPLALGAKVTQLGADISTFGLAAAAKIAVSADFPPNLAGIQAGFSSALSPAELGANLNPANWVSGNASANTDLVAKLGIIDAQIAIVTPLLDGFQLGLETPGLAGWSYSGRAPGFGRTLQAATANGFGKTAPGADIQALIIASDAFASWSSFSSGFNTGSSSSVDVGAAPASDTLTYLGELSGAEWNTGLFAQFDALDFILADLRGEKSSLEAQVQVSLGLNLPDPTAIVNVGLNVDIVAAVGEMVSAQVDVSGALGAIQAEIDATISLAGSISAALSVGGLTFWTYSGPAAGLGAALAGELAGGLPGVGNPRGPAYGVVVCGTPAAMGDFGTIFKTS